MDTRALTSTVTAAPLRWPARLALALVALVPWALVYLHHFTAGEGATGFIQVDMPFYAANGRAIFERGNGLFYPNAYDPDPSAPVILLKPITWLVRHLPLVSCFPPLRHLLEYSFPMLF